jgi:hypothetical protein
VLRLGKQPEAGELLSLLAAFFAAVAIVVRQVVLGLMSGRAIPHNNEPTVPASLRLFQTRMIVGLALLEGAAFFNLVAFMTEGHWWTLIVVAVLLVWMLASFPTHGRLKQWIEDREQLKSLGSNIT